MSLTVQNSFVLSALGNTWTGFQGPSGGSASTPLSIGGISGVTLSGYIFLQQGNVATATSTKLYDSANDLPATWNYLWVWCDQAWTIQLITSATNIIIDCLAQVPFVLGKQTMLAAASTTAISTTQPSTTAIAKVYLGNYSGNAANYMLAAIL